MLEFMLSTLDNPYNPFDNFEEWYQYDTFHGYNSCGLLDRIARTSDLLSEADYNAEISNAIDAIVALHNGKIYTKVSRTINQT